MPAAADAGAGYAFQRDEGGAGNWGEVKKLLASDAGAGDLFGYSVAVNGDTTVVGAPFEAAGASFAGAAYVFDLLLPKPTPSITPTPTASPPSATATPGSPEMLLTIKAGDCDDPSRPTTCDVPAGSKFQLSVDALAVPATGYVGMQTYIDFGSDLIYDFDAASAEDEIVWPDCAGVTAVKAHAVAKLNDLGTPVLDPTTANPTFNPSSEVIHHGCLSGLIPPLPASFYSDIIVEIELTCSSIDTSTEVILRSTEDPLASTSGSVFSFLDPATLIQTITVPKVSNLTINCVQPVGGISLDSDLRVLPLERPGAAGGSYGVVTLSIAIAAAVVLLAGIGWYAARRRPR